MSKEKTLREKLEDILIEPGTNKTNCNYCGSVWSSRINKNKTYLNTITALEELFSQQYKEGTGTV